jgi:[acyl-carrier-protein] S-malonyltransferase
MAALQLGGVVASVLAQSAAARAVFAHVTSGCSVLPDQVEAYHRRNPDQFTDADGVEQPLDAVAATIMSTLLAAARRRYFIDWLGRRSAGSIHLEPGYEHPGDPRQPDATHRH